jgi:hypothetical protein
MKQAILALLVTTAGLLGSAAAPHRSETIAADWHMNATIIEACSCPMFCQCYFNSEPSDHAACCPDSKDSKGSSHFCRFNNAFQVNKGTHAGVKLDGAKFWVAGDLGGDFSKGEMDWAVLHFDPAVTKEQRDGIAAILAHLYPVKWGSFEVREDHPIEWTGGKERAVAKLDGGKAAEVVLVKNQGMTDDPIVIKNLRYWGAPRNDGFIMMANEVEAYRAGSKPFEFKGSNGFMITVDISSKDVAQPKDAGTKKNY